MKDLLDSEDVEQSMEENRRLLGRILIKGESNITSASISKDGSILAVSTVAAIKVFRLAASTGPQEELSIRKVGGPPAFESAGATLLQISPDGQWLCWIQDGTKVFIARIVRDDTSEISIHARPAKLARLRRDIPKHVRLGGLGGYDRRVAHIAFSPDSNILATADLAGYVDTWVMQHGDVQNGVSSAEDDDASSDSSDSSDSEDEKADGSGPHWTRNPKASLFPKLSNTPVVLSFSETALGPSLQGEGSATADYILLAVTNASRVYTFHPLTGSLTKWSRRNTAWKLPEEIRATRDLIKGAVWQGSRIWLYGVSFLFMLDISLDYNAEEETATHDKRSRKRKRGADSGAGSKTEAGQALVPTHVRMSVGGDGKKGQWVDVAMVDADAPTNGAGEDEDDEDDDTHGGELQKLRDREVRAPADEGAAAEEGQQRKWWHTYKYRPILGVVPLEVTGDKAQANGTGRSKKGNGVVASVPPPLEVALVERPKWDVDMPVRYVED